MKRAGTHSGESVTVKLCALALSFFPLVIYIGMNVLAAHHKTVFLELIAN